MGTVNLLNSLRQLQNKCAVVIVTTDKVYENQECNFSYREIAPLGGHDPYSSSKAAVEVATASWRNPFFGGNNNILLATAQAGNPIGYGYWSKDELIPEMVRYLSVGEVILDRNCNALRPWQHVLAPLTDTCICQRKSLIVLIPLCKVLLTLDPSQVL